MEVMGKVTTGVILTATAGIIVMVILSVPDIRRYLKIRKM